MLNDFGRKYTVEDCCKVSVTKLDLLGASFIEIGIQHINIAWSNCYYGGQRPWFICPNCGLRVGMLYRKPLASNFLCRRCNDLSYQLQRYHRSGSEPYYKAIRYYS